MTRVKSLRARAEEKGTIVRAVREVSSCLYMVEGVPPTAHGCQLPPVPPLGVPRLNSVHSTNRCRDTLTRKVRYTGYRKPPRIVDLLHDGPEYTSSTTMGDIVEESRVFQHTLGPRLESGGGLLGPKTSEPSGLNVPSWRHAATV